MSNIQNILSLGDFLSEVQKLFNFHISNRKYTIKCEVNRLKFIKRYYYFDLVDIDETGKIISKIRGTLFNSIEMNKFLNGVSIEDYNDLIGKKIVLHGNANFHKDFGFSFNISSIDIEYFIGEAELQKQKIIQELISLGLYDKNKSLTYSFPPFNIAIISSKNSEGLKDFESVLNNSKLNYNLEYFYSNIHGDKSIPDILNSIGNIINLNNEYKNQNNLDNLDNLKQNKYDFIAIIRGGGGAEGLNWANNKDIVKLFLTSNIPIITAIGHTSDNSILDMVAKYHCKTPTEGAKIVIDIYNKYYEALSNINKSINDLIKYKLILLKNDNRNLYLDINNKIRNKKNYLKNELGTIHINVNGILKSKVFLYKENLFLFKNINNIISKKSFDYNKDIENIKHQTVFFLQKQITNLKNKLNLSYNVIKQHNYDSILKRGYSLTLDKKSNRVVSILNTGNNYILKHKSGDYIIQVK